MYTPSSTVLQAGVAELIERYPILQCCVPVPHTPQPKYEFNTAMQVTDIVHTRLSELPHAQLIERELLAVTQLDLHAGPLWRVTLVQGSAERAGTRLVVSLNHILTDGIGGRNLLS